MQLVLIDRQLHTKELQEKKLQSSKNKNNMTNNCLYIADFDGLSLDFVGSKKPAHEGIKER